MRVSLSLRFLPRYFVLVVVVLLLVTSLSKQDVIHGIYLLLVLSCILFWNRIFEPRNIFLRLIKYYNRLVIVLLLLYQMPLRQFTSESCSAFRWMGFYKLRHNWMDFGPKSAMQEIIVFLLLFCQEWIVSHRLSENIRAFFDGWQAEQDQRWWKKGGRRRRRR